MDVISTDKVSWNAAQGIILEISNRRQQANTFFIQSNIGKAFTTLISIKQSVIQSFNKEERKQLEEIEDRFWQVSGLLTGSAAVALNKETRDVAQLARRIAYKLYPEYNDLLMDLLNKYGYLVGQKSDASRMKF